MPDGLAIKMSKSIKVGGQNIFFFLDQINILSALTFVGVSSSRFCFHSELNISGNCRACLLELEGFEKPLPACVADLELGQII